MLGLVQNAKANAVRASLDTDSMVLSHVQVHSIHTLEPLMLRFMLSARSVASFALQFVALVPSSSSP
jgi:ribosomal protein L22